MSATTPAATTPAATTPAATTIKRFIPGLALLQGFSLALLRTELVVAITVFAVLVPSAMAYGELAGVTPVAGLYVALGAMLMYGEFWLAVLTALGVLTVGVLQGILVALTFSLINIIYHIAQPNDALLDAVDASGGTLYRSIDDQQKATTAPGLIVYRFDAPLVFANAAYFTERLQALIANAGSGLQCVILDAEAIGDIDSTAAEALENLDDDLARQGIEFWVARANKPLRNLLETTGLTRGWARKTSIPRCGRRRRPGAQPLRRMASLLRLAPGLVLRRRQYKNSPFGRVRSRYFVATLKARRKRHPIHDSVGKYRQVPAGRSACHKITRHATKRRAPPLRPTRRCSKRFNGRTTPISRTPPAGLLPAWKTRSFAMTADARFGI